MAVFGCDINTPGSKGWPKVVSRKRLVCSLPNLLDSSTGHRLRRHGVDPRHDVEQLFVDAALAHPVKPGAEIREQFSDVAIGALHGRQAARDRKSTRLNSGAEQRNKQVLADEGPQRSEEH